MPPQQNPASSGQPQSFKPYTGKAPAIVQIVGGILWLGAAGLIILGLLGLIAYPISGILFLLAAVLMIITAKSLFAMKKTAFRNTVITAVLVFISLAYSSLSKGGFQWSSLVTPIILLIVAFYYKDSFVN